MVSEDSPSNSNSSILHQFIISNSIANQNHFSNQHFHAYNQHSLPLLPEDQSDRIIHERRLMDLLGTSNEPGPRGPGRRLALSLSSIPSNQFRPLNSSLLNPAYVNNPGETARDNQSCNPGINRMINDYPSFSLPLNSQSCSTPLYVSAVGGSKYLKPTQTLLEEIVSIAGKDVDESNQKYVQKLSRTGRKGSYELSSELKAEFSNNAEVMAEKHGSYVTLLKLLALLEEVEGRYEEYYHHMGELVSSFEVIAGLGAGKSYTALALRAMSKHFCSLRNAILSQIHATKQKMDKDTPKRISSRLSQLSLFDHDGRQNRTTLQQIGIMHGSRQAQAWRPIRGLPETSVTVLRAWLFEHFLHPYPNDSEKLMLASQTGLSKNQVSNWFINARVRLWKPMIEEMYKEEFAESSNESNQLSTIEGVGDSVEDLN